MFEQLEKKIGYVFSDKSLLETALTHSSFANEKQLKRDCNERLEFLGDSVLGVITAEYFYKNFCHLPEGKMTKKRAACVCEKSLYSFASEIDLGKHILLGKGEENTGGRKRSSILADAFEALIAAIYLDGGLDHARNFVLDFIAKSASEEESFVDYKTALQEIIQKNPNEKISYNLIGASGPDHDKTFEIEVKLNDNSIASGTGRSKKQAEQQAAKKALEIIGVKK
ncbi:MAG: ribonuclease III [Clostridia bacterium]